VRPRTAEQNRAERAPHAQAAARAHNGQIELGSHNCCCRLAFFFFLLLFSLTFLRRAPFGRPIFARSHQGNELAFQHLASRKRVAAGR